MPCLGPLAGLSHPFTHLTVNLYDVPGDVLAGDTAGNILVWGGGRQQIICIRIIITYNSSSNRNLM